MKPFRGKKMRDVEKPMDTVAENVSLASFLSGKLGSPSVTGSISSNLVETGNFDGLSEKKSKG